MNVFTIITAIISIITLIAVIYQSISMRITVENQIYQSFINNSIELDKVLITYPEIRKYVYGNEPVDEDIENLEQIMSVIELVIDITENIEVYKKFIPKSRYDGWIAFLKDTERTPAYSYYMQKYGHWFTVR